MAKKHHHMEQRGKIWYFVGMVKGKRYHEPLFEDENLSMDKRDDYLKEIRNYGDIVSLKPLVQQEPKEEQELLFGQVAMMWAAVHEVAKSTWLDYKLSMNNFILPVFGNMPINDIRKHHLQAFRKKTMSVVQPGKKEPCKEKRMNNIFVPLRCVFNFAYENELIEKNVMDLVKNLVSGKTDINPLSIEEVIKFLGCVEPYYKNFFKIAFFSGMRFGEMAALMWSNVDFEEGYIRVRATLVKGEKKIPKTKSSNRDIKMSLPLREAFMEQKNNFIFNNDYVFMNSQMRNLVPHSINSHIWHPTLEKAGLKPRPLYQTRHTFATLMLDAGEQPGWVANQMGHTSLKMIYEHYYKYIKNYKNNEGTAFEKNVYEPAMKR